MQMETKTAMIAGSTGLIGSLLLEELLKDDDYSEVQIWVRNTGHIANPKLKEILVDYTVTDRLPVQLPDHVFCCLGTTIRTAGTKEAFRRVDFELVKDLAKRAERSGSEKFLVVSSLGANASSGNFYLKTKGEMEEAVKSCRIPSIFIFRPSMLLGKRKEFRLGELIGKGVMKAVGFMLLGSLRKYRGIEAADVAKAMVKMAKEDSKGVLILESDELARNT